MTFDFRRIIGTADQVLIDPLSRKSCQQSLLNDSGQGRALAGATGPRAEGHISWFCVIDVTRPGGQIGWFCLIDVTRPGGHNGWFCLPCGPSLQT